MTSAGFDDASRGRIRGTFDEARRAEWVEFDRECDKCLVELRREIEQRKFTLAELDEEEQTVERLRQRHRDLRARDRFSAGDQERIEQRLDECTTVLAHFTELVTTKSA